MASLLHYSERITPMPEKRYFFGSIIDWCRTNVQRNGVSAHRRLSEVQVQGMAFVLQKTLTKNAVTSNADVGSAFVTLSQTCKLAALTVDYIIQGKLTDFTGQPTKITEVAKRIKDQSQLYASADYDAVWMLIAPPDSRTGDWTSFVSSAAAEVAAQHFVLPQVVLNDVLSGSANDPLIAPGCLLRYYAFQSLVDNPAQFFRLVSDTELVTTTSAMAERRRGLLRVAAAAHALENLPNLIKLRLMETSFERLSEAIGPLPLTRHQTQSLEDTMRYINRVDVLPSKEIALKIQSWLNDPTEPNMHGMYQEPVSELTAGMITAADFKKYCIKQEADPEGNQTDRSLVAFYQRIEKYTREEYVRLAQRTPGSPNTPEYISSSLLNVKGFNIGAEQRFLMTGLPILALSPRFDVAAVMKLGSQYVSTMTTLLQSFSGHHESYITAQDATELPRLVNFEPYLSTDTNPWRNRIDRQNSANIQQSEKGLPVIMAPHTKNSPLRNYWCDYVNSPSLTRDLEEMDLPLVVDSNVVRRAFINPNIDAAAYAYWDNELRAKIIELIPDAGPTLIPVQYYPSGDGVKAMRLTDPDHNKTGKAMEVTRPEIIDTVRDYVTRATGLSGKYLAIALQVEGTSKRLATLLSSFCTVYTLKNGPSGQSTPGATAAPAGATAAAPTWNPADYDLVVGDGIPYGLVPATQAPNRDVQPTDSYALLADLCHDQFIPLVKDLVYVRILKCTPNALANVSATAASLTGLKTNSNPFYSTTLSVGRRYVALKRDANATTPVAYFVEAPALIHMATLPPLARFGAPPAVVLSRTHAYTLRTTAVLGESSPMLTQANTHTLDRYTTWPGVALDRLALHGETTKIITGASDSSAVEQAMAEAAALTAAADTQVKDSLKVASTPVEAASAVETSVKVTATKHVKQNKSDLPLA